MGNSTFTSKNKYYRDMYQSDLTSSVTNHLVILIPKHPTGHIRSDSQSVLKEKSLSLEEISETNMVIRFDAYYNYLPLSLATEAFSFPNFS